MKKIFNIAFLLILSAATLTSCGKTCLSPSGDCNENGYGNDYGQSITQEGLYNGVIEFTPSAGMTQIPVKIGNIIVHASMTDIDAFNWVVLRHNYSQGGLNVVVNVYQIREDNTDGSIKYDCRIEGIQQ